MTLAIRVGGVKELVAGFDDLARTTRNRLMRIGMNAGAGVIRDAAVANIPRDSGLLKKSMKVKVKIPDASFNTKHHGRPAYAVIGPARRVEGRVASVRGKNKVLTVRRAIRRSFGGGGYVLRRPSRYAHLVERGTKPHAIRATSKRVLASSEAVFGSSVRHPGTAGKGFMKKAVSTSGEAAKANIVSKIKSGVSEWAAKRAAKVSAKYALGV